MPIIMFVLFVLFLIVIFITILIFSQDEYQNKMKLIMLKYVIPIIPVHTLNHPYPFTKGWDKVDIPLHLEQAFYEYYYDRSSRGDKTLHTNEMGNVIKEMTTYVKQHHKEIIKSQALPSVNIGNTERIRELVDQRMPFVIRQGHSHKITYEKILDIARDTKVIFNRKKDDQIITYVDRLSSIEDTNDYVSNCESLLQKYPELVPNVDLIRSLGALHTKDNRLSKQLFISNKKGNGTPLHCAWASNMFYQVDGRKKWVFVHPNNTHLMYGFLQNTGLYSGSASFSIDMVQNSEKFELLKYCPRYSVILEAGDILYNPEAWWHGITNLTEKSVGIATRWEQTNDTYKMFFSNLWLSCMGNHNLVHTLEQIYEKTGLLSLNVDEHMENEYKQDSLSFLEKRVQGGDNTPVDLNLAYPI